VGRLTARIAAVPVVADGIVVRDASPRRFVSALASPRDRVESFSALPCAATINQLSAAPRRHCGLESALMSAVTSLRRDQPAR